MKDFSKDNKHNLSAHNKDKTTNTWGGKQQANQQSGVGTPKHSEVTFKRPLPDRERTAQKGTAQPGQVINKDKSKHR